MSEGAFPRPRRLTGRAVAWLEFEIDEWLLSRPVAPAKAGQNDI